MVLLLQCMLYRCVICSVFCYFFILWYTLYWKYFPDTWHSLQLVGCFAGRSYMAKNFIAAHRTPWTTSLHTLHFLHSPCPPLLPGPMPSKEKRHRKHLSQDLVVLENTASVLDEQCGGIFTRSPSPGSIFQPPMLLLKAS